MPSRNARVMCIVSLFSRFGLPFRTSIFIVIILLPPINFSSDIFIINPCRTHVNPRSVEWIISMIFLVQIRGLGGVTLSKQCKAFSRFLWERIAVLAGIDYALLGLLCIRVIRIVVFAHLWSIILHNIFIYYRSGS